MFDKDLTRFWSFSPFNIDDSFPVETGILVFCIYPQLFSGFFSFADESQKKLFSDVVKHMLLKNIHTHSLNLLNFVCIVGFDAEIALENAKLAILERLVFQISFSPSQPWSSAD